jgi:hypothetical protein
MYSVALTLRVGSSIPSTAWPLQVGARSHASGLPLKRAARRYRCNREQWRRNVRETPEAHA